MQPESYLRGYMSKLRGQDPLPTAGKVPIGSPSSPQRLGQQAAGMAAMSPKTQAPSAPPAPSAGPASSVSAATATPPPKSAPPAVKKDDQQ